MEFRSGPLEVWDEGGEEGLPGGAHRARVARFVQRITEW
jgi:hypothetical protein